MSFLTGRKLKNSTKINLFIHVGCLTERLIRNSAIEDYPEKDKFQKIHKKEIRQIQAAFSVIEKTYSVKIPISENWLYLRYFNGNMRFFEGN